MEMLAEVGFNVKRASPFARTYVISNSNGYLVTCYSPPASYYGRGGYEVTECLLAPEWEAVFMQALEGSSRSWPQTEVAAAGRRTPYVLPRVICTARSSSASAASTEAAPVMMNVCLGSSSRTAVSTSSYGTMMMTALAAGLDALEQVQPVHATRRAGAGRPLDRAQALQGEQPVHVLQGARAVQVVRRTLKPLRQFLQLRRDELLEHRRAQHAGHIALQRQAPAPGAPDPQPPAGPLLGGRRCRRRARRWRTSCPAACADRASRPLGARWCPSGSAGCPAAGAGGQLGS